MEINETKIYKYLEGKNNRFYCERIDTVASDVKFVLSRNPVMFSNYTNHDIGHSARVADYMVDLLPLPIENYSDTELVIMLFSAIFHDIGMAVSETENKLKPSEQNEIRKIHHIRSEDYLNTQYNKDDVFKIDNESSVSFKSLLALLSRAHGESYEWIQKNLPSLKQYGNDTVNPQFISCLLRLGDYLDFDSRRTPDSLYKFLKLSSTSKFEWEKHFSITNFPKIDEHRNIYFTGECEEPEIYLGILNYFASIENEIKEAKELLRVNDEKYLLQIGNTIQNKIEHKTFDSVDLQFSMDYLAISKLLMGEQLYNDKKCALREIIQNALDAVLLKKEISKQNDSIYEPIIKIIISNDKVTIKDNGIGMSSEDIRNYFLKLGHSFYQSEEFHNLPIKYKPISHYGIGFISSFLLSDVITVKTTSFKQPNMSNILQLMKSSRFVIQKKEENCYPESGTQISFNRDAFFRVFKSKEEVIRYISETFKDTGVKIVVSENEEETSVLFEQRGLKNIIDISEYLSNVQCSCSSPLLDVSKGGAKFHGILSIISPFSNTDEYLYDTDYFSSMIVDYEDLGNWQLNNSCSYDIRRAVTEGKYLRCLEIYPLDCNESETYYQAQEILEDEEETFEYMRKKYYLFDPIKIYITDENLFYSFDNYELIDMELDVKGDNEKNDFTRLLQDFIKKQHYNYDVVSCLIKTEQVSVYIDNDLFAKYEEKHRLSNYEKNSLFVKNVKISYFDITIPVLLRGLILANFEINILLDKCYPDASREKIDTNTSNKLSFAIGRAIHLYVLEHTKLSSSEKEYIENFIEYFYGDIETNEFCKDLDI